MVNDIREFGSVQKAVLGITYIELDADKAKENNITATKEGIYVASVSERSAAMEAGLKEGDVIVKINNTTVLPPPAGPGSHTGRLCAGVGLRGAVPPNRFADGLAAGGLPQSVPDAPAAAILAKL